MSEDENIRPLGRIGGVARPLATQLLASGLSPKEQIIAANMVIADAINRHIETSVRAGALRTMALKNSEIESVMASIRRNLRDNVMKDAT